MKSQKGIVCQQRLNKRPRDKQWPFFWQKK